MTHDKSKSLIYNPVEERDVGKGVNKNKTVYNEKWGL